MLRWREGWMHQYWGIGRKAWISHLYNKYTAWWTHGSDAHEQNHSKITFRTELLRRMDLIFWIITWTMTRGEFNCSRPGGTLIRDHHRDLIGSMLQKDVPLWRAFHACDQYSNVQPSVIIWFAGWLWQVNAQRSKSTRYCPNHNWVSHAFVSIGHWHMELDSHNAYKDATL